MYNRRVKDEDIIRLNPSKEAGLTTEEVDKRIKEGLDNKTELVVGKSTWDIIRTNILSFFNILLIVLAAFMIYGNVNDNNPNTKWYSGTFFVGILIANIVIGLYQDIKAKHLMKKMKLITTKNVMVIRNGESIAVNPQDLVLDDIVILKAGDQIPSDCILLDGEITVNESFLTGESVDVNKKNGDLIYSGTSITSGRCYAKIEKVGKDNYIETISAKAKAFKRNPSKIIKSLNSLFRVIGFIIVILFVAILITYASIGQLNDKEGFVRISAPLTAQFVAMVPSGLYLLTSFTLATGVISLHKRHANVQDLYSIEMLARSDILCCDKTGTITDGTMNVVDVVPLGDISKQEIGDIIANVVRMTNDDNFTALALKQYFKPLKKVDSVSILPFNSKNKYSGASLSSGGTYLIGAAEYFSINNKEEIITKSNEYTSRGLRVLILVKGKELISGDSYPHEVMPLSFIILQDHVKDTAKETFKWFEDNHVEIKVISGDNAITVSEIAKVAGIKNADKYISLEGMDNEQIKKIATEYTIFGRVTPEQKEALVIALKEADKTVAMTGDGVNDMLALKRADCSIAMNSGAEAAKNVSHIVLMNDDFSTMPEIVAEGRRVINNLERTGSLFLTKTIFAMVISVVFWILSIVSSGKYSYPFMPNNLMVWEICGIGMSAFFISLERNPKPINKGFLSNIFFNAVPSAIIILIGVLACYVAYILQASGVMYTGVSDFGFSLTDPRLPRYGATGLAVVVFTALSLMALFNISRPINKYRGIVVGGATLIAALCFLLSGIFANTSLFGVDFQSFSNPNLILLAAVIIVLAALLYLLKPIIEMIRNKKKEEKKNVD